MNLYSKKWPEVGKNATDYKKPSRVFYVWGKTRKEDLRPTAQGGGVQKEVHEGIPYPF